MKKYLSALPINRYNPIYYYTNDDELAYDQKTFFPVLPLIRETVDEEDKEVELLFLVNKEDEVTEANKEHFKEELAQAGFDFQVNYSFKYVGVADSSEAQLNTFITICEYFDDGDQGYYDLTFGTKGLLLIALNALNYCMKECNDFEVIRIVYGYLDHNAEEPKGIYTYYTTSFYLNKILEKIDKKDLQEMKPILMKLLF